jgi:ATP-dependent RNA helicase DeaD
MDHLERKSLDLSRLKTLVLDEADEMLRMGFIDDVEWILEHIPAERQTALFSATMPEQIRRVAQKYLRDPQEVKIKSATSTVSAIQQRYWQVSGLHKLDALTRIMEVEDSLDAAIIFVRTKTATEELAQKLEARGYAAAALNGDMNQASRERVIEQLKSGGLDIVIATDVAARGIDVPRVSHVINYDIPYDVEAYVHRIGRTGRAGRTGTAILFVSPREMRMLRTIEKVTRQNISPLRLPTKQDVADRRVAQFKQQVIKTLEAGELSFFEEVVTQIEEEANVGAHEVAAALAFLVQKSRPLLMPEKEVRSFEADSAEGRPERKERFERPERGERFERKERPERGERPERTDAKKGKGRDLGNVGNMVRYRIEVGRNQGATPKDIVGCIANEADIQSRYIGHIALFDEYSTVELPDSLPKDALMLLKEVEIKQCPLLIHRLDGESEVIAPPRRKWGGDVDGNRAPRGAAPGGKGGFSKPGFGNKKPGGAGGFGGNKPPAKRRAPREG